MFWGSAKDIWRPSGVQFGFRRESSLRKRMQRIEVLAHHLLN